MNLFIGEVQEEAKAPPRVAANGAAGPSERAFELSGSRQLTEWMAEQDVALGFTTYQAGKMFLVGRRDDGLSIFERTLNRCMGMLATENGLWVSARYQLWRFENALEPGARAGAHDRLYVPQVGSTTGDLDIHDIALDAEGQIVFVNTLFSCLATTSDTHSFRPLWKPAFISKLAAEDRCHLNGLAMRDGRPGWVTAVSESDVADGWRDKRVDGGCLIDVESNEVVLRGLSMPHSPRWYQDRLWLHNSGTGEFGFVDLEAGRFEPLCFCAGYLRGLAFFGDYAVVGLSLPRGNRTFEGLPLEAALADKEATPRCGLQVIDLRSGDAVHWLRIEGIIHELYDVVVLPGVERPKAIGFKSDEICRVLSVDDWAEGDLDPAAESESEGKTEGESKGKSKG